MVSERSARNETSVARLYRTVDVAEAYLRKRFSHSWSRLLHRTQVEVLNQLIRTARPATILELAPGPARLTVELQGVQQGVMVEYSQAMLELARQRLTAAGLREVWELQQGSAFELSKMQQRFDAVFTFRFIRHFSDDERSRLYREIATCLRPNGLFTFDVVNSTVRHRLDARQPHQSAGELHIFDAVYTPETFAREMHHHGFRVLRLVPAVKHFTLQSWISYRLDHRLPHLSEALVRLLEAWPSTEPLEWVAVCQKPA